MLNVLFVEAALEVVPRKISRHPSVTRNAKRDGKNPERVLLDRSLHHRAMLDLPEGEKRGRPDILHFCLLEALGSPLNKAGKLKSMAQNLNGDFIDFAPELGYPGTATGLTASWSSYFAEKRVPPGGEEKPLMTLVRRSLKDIKENIKPSRTFALTSHGKAEKLAELCKQVGGGGESPRLPRRLSPWGYEGGDACGGG